MVVRFETTIGDLMQGPCGLKNELRQDVFQLRRVFENEEGKDETRLEDRTARLRPAEDERGGVVVDVQERQRLPAQRKQHRVYQLNKLQE